MKNKNMLFKSAAALSVLSVTQTSTELTVTVRDRGFVVLVR